MDLGYEEIMRLRSNAAAKRENKPRICVDCESDISALHGNRKRCVDCRKIARARYDQVHEARRVFAVAVVKYMKENTPKALDNIKRTSIETRLKKLREKQK